MEKDKFWFFQNLYKILRKHDKDILNHFCDFSISDEDYFTYAINYDIISNSINILTNYLSGTIESTGVDLSCRMIIEAFEIMNLDAKGLIDATQKKIYRYLYSYVDCDNLKDLIKDEDVNDERYIKVLNEKEFITKIMVDYFHCSEKKINAVRSSSDDPCFYLKKNINDNISFSYLLQKHPLFFEEATGMYSFFSLIIHPRYEVDEKYKRIIMETRQRFIDTIITYVFSYLKDCKLLIKEDELSKINNFDDDFWFNPLLAHNCESIKGVEYLFNKMINQFCNLEDGFDYYTFHLLEKSRYLLLDMLISISLGYKEHVISIFKEFIEEYSVFFFIGSVDNITEFNILKKSFIISSRLQIINNLIKNGYDNKIELKDELCGVLDYYKTKYGMRVVGKFV